MNDNQLLRYSRQIMLPSIGIEGQERLLESRVLIVGLGGLGSPAAMYLAAAGVGTLDLVDFDRVDLTNLQRQIIHTTDRIDQLKVESAREALHAINPEIDIETFPDKLDDSELNRLVERADIVLDGTDNFSIRFAINKACHRHQTPLVSAAAIRMEGQVSVFTGQPDSPCYHCLYPDEGEMDETCSSNGVLAPLVGIVGSIQATEAIKVLTGAGKSLEGKLLLLDALHMEWRTLKLKQDPACPVCSKQG
ncbi:MAG: molybdopterin-synthase adenylyltransferase MoeB [Candidatus Thiodiazotropha sp. DIVDIV]